MKQAKHGRKVVGAAKTKGRQTVETTRESLRPITIKLAPMVIDKILHEVARRKLARLPNRTIQGVVTDAVEKLVAERR